MPPGDRGAAVRRPGQPPLAHRLVAMPNRGRVRVAARRGPRCARPRGGHRRHRRRPAVHRRRTAPVVATVRSSCPRCGRPVRASRCNGCRTYVAGARGVATEPCSPRATETRAVAWDGPCAAGATCPSEPTWSGRRWSTWLGGAMARGGRSRCTVWSDHATTGSPSTRLTRFGPQAIHRCGRVGPGSGYHWTGPRYNEGTARPSAVEPTIRGAIESPRRPRHIHLLFFAGPLVHDCVYPGFPSSRWAHPHSADLAPSAAPPVRHVRLTRLSLAELAGIEHGLQCVFLTGLEFERQWTSTRSTLGVRAVVGTWTDGFQVEGSWSPLGLFGRLSVTAISCGR